MTNPLISIILPTYNGNPLWFKESIDSVLIQSYGDFEIIIINDGSTNNIEKTILEYVEKDSRIRYYKNEVNLKITTSLNKGIGLSNGKYIARIDDDDIWCDKDKLKKQVEFMENNLDYGLYGTGSIFIDEEGKELYRDLKRGGYENIRNHLLQGNHFSHPTIIIRKSVLEKIGNYCEKKHCLYTEDYDLWLKIGTVSKFDNLQEYSIKYRVRNGSTTGKKRTKQKINTFLLYLRYFKYYPSKFKGLCAQLISLLFPKVLINLIVKFKNN